MTSQMYSWEKYYTGLQIQNKTCHWCKCQFIRSGIKMPVAFNDDSFCPKRGLRSKLAQHQAISSAKCSKPHLTWVQNLCGTRLHGWSPPLWQQKRGPCHLYRLHVGRTGRSQRYGYGTGSIVDRNLNTTRYKLQLRWNLDLRKLLIQGVRSSVCGWSWSRDEIFCWGIVESPLIKGSRTLQ